MCHWGLAGNKEERTVQLLIFKPAVGCSAGWPSTAAAPVTVRVPVQDVSSVSTAADAAH